MTSRTVAGLAAVAMFLPIIAGAGDTPEVAERKRQLLQAYKISHTTGVCDVFSALRNWQKAGWPEGETVVTQFLVDKILPQFTADASALQEKSTAELEADFGQFCAQGKASTARVVEGLNRASAAEADAAKRFRDTLVAAAFLGQCQAASALYLQGAPGHKDRLEKFVIAEVYSKDPKYRHADIDRENSTKAVLYWKDCDTAQAGFQSIFEQLKPAP
jgi:hypothetical protein